ncbi:hypothetical protein KUCAC02_022674 [Chaenocephalus aceratus]|uniref:Uncharacterized protein n=1 Tax=Chaenocephalus aceratus TaxID=36190 RepID=A0ACB9XPT0_CHAAC|nr:hypothetical protein KUCAC02_022674 [Chaenocephalus aceratus]
MQEGKKQGIWPSFIDVIGLGMRRTSAWIAECPQCQSKRANIKEKKDYSPREVTEPLELVGIDLVGGELCNEVNYNLCERLGIQRSLCSPYHPQTNGLTDCQARGASSDVETYRWSGKTDLQLGDGPAGPSVFYILRCVGSEVDLSQLCRACGELSSGHKVDQWPILSDVWEGGEVPKEYKITEEKVCSLVQREEVFQGLQKQEAVSAEVTTNMTKSRERRPQASGQFPRG